MLLANAELVQSRTVQCSFCKVSMQEPASISTLGLNILLVTMEELKELLKDALGLIKSTLLHTLVKRFLLYVGSDCNINRTIIIIFTIENNKGNY